MHELCYFYQWLKNLLCSPLWLHALLPFGSVALWCWGWFCHSSIPWLCSRMGPQDLRDETHRWSSVGNRPGQSISTGEQLVWSADKPFVQLIILPLSTWSLQCWQFVISMAWNPKQPPCLEEGGILGAVLLWDEVHGQGPAAGDAGRAGGPSVPSP